mmetsp:Transcript_43616/g.60589  ORF Transcript_43616/g.60589 Transcript_43616/m.60589 type:complete len:203 (-) Transcript_43616:535-1143(-)
MATGKVRDDDLPCRRRLSHQVANPHFLLVPELRKPMGTVLDRLWAARGCAGGIRVVVLGAAHVVARVLLRWHCIDKVGVKEVIVHVKVQVLVDDGGLVVRRRENPAITKPGVGQLLVPTIVELEATPVMVSKNAEPRLLAESWPLVNALEDLVELMLRGIGNLIHGSSASLLDAAPVKIISNIEDILRIHERCSLLERLCDQ